MNQKIQSGQNGSGVPKDQKPASEQPQEERRGQSKPAEQHETGSTANSQPGSGSG
jgi:hypothetical protein